MGAAAGECVVGTGVVDARSTGGGANGANISLSMKNQMQHKKKTHSWRKCPSRTPALLLACMQALDMNLGRNTQDAVPVEFEAQLHQVDRPSSVDNQSFLGPV